MSNIERKNKGRQKVAMVRMAKQSNRLVTFSKRRTGLFKKASELCTLCDVKLEILVFSPGRKVYSFGHPSFDDVINRYLYGNMDGWLRPDDPLEANCVTAIIEKLELLNDEIKAERKSAGELRKATEANAEFRSLESIDKLEPASLLGFKGSLTQMKEKVVQGNAQRSSGENRIDPSNPALMNPNPMDGAQRPPFGMGLDGSMLNLTGTDPVAMPGNFESYTALLMGDSPTHDA